LSHKPNQTLVVAVVQTVVPATALVVAVMAQAHALNPVLAVVITLVAAIRMVARSVQMILAQAVLLIHVQSVLRDLVLLNQNLAVNVAASAVIKHDSP
jgi:hypothetical protein